MFLFRKKASLNSKAYLQMRQDIHIFRIFDEPGSPFRTRERHAKLELFSIYFVLWASSFEFTLPITLKNTTVKKKII